MKELVPLSRPARLSALVIGEMGSDRRLRYLAEGWRQRDWDVAEIDFARFFVNGRTIYDKIAGRFLGKHHTANLRRAIAARIATNAFDVVVFTKVIGANRELLETIRQAGATSVAWYPDVSFDHPAVDFESLKYFDLFFTTKSFHVDYLEGIIGKGRVFHLDHGYLPAVHRRYEPRLTDAEKTIDCTFIGNHSEYKEQHLRKIVGQLPDTSFLICGNRWDQAEDYGPNVTVIGAQTGDFFARILNHTRIALALHHGPAGREGWEDLVSARSFEFPACGAFLLHPDNAEIRNSYVVGEEIDVFSSPDEAADKIRHYVEHPELREAMAEAAWQRAVPDYSLPVRARKMADKIEQYRTRTGESEEYLEVGPMKRSHVEFTVPPRATGLLVGEAGNSHHLSGMSRGLAKVGIDAIELDSNIFQPRPHHRWMRAAERFIFSVRNRDARRLITRRVRDTGADFVLFVKAIGATNELLRALRAEGRLTVCWYPDVNFDHPGIRSIDFDLFDVFITTKVFHLDYLQQRLGRERVFHVDHGYLPAVHQRYEPPLKDRQKIFDCLYIGNHSAYKNDWLLAIAEGTPEASFAVCGERWDRASLPENVRIFPQRTGHQFARMAAHSRIALSFHHGPGGSSDWHDLVSTRTFEYPACGLFTLHIDNDELRKFYTPGVDCDVFSTPAEAIERIRHYLAHPDMREDMAAKGWQRTVPNYSVEHRAAECADIILKVMNGNNQ